jgi:hypothetical protein
MAEYTQEQMNELLTKLDVIVTHFVKILDESKEQTRLIEEHGPCGPSVEPETFRPLHEELMERAAFDDFIRDRGEERIREWIEDMENGDDVATAAAKRGKFGLAQVERARLISRNDPE